jgi:Ca2+-binding RTX toxin-like protein
LIVPLFNTYLREVFGRKKMAVVTSLFPYDIAFVNLNKIYVGVVSDNLYKNVNYSGPNGAIYPDLYEVLWQENSVFYSSDFFGSNLTKGSYTGIMGGTVSAYVEGYWVGDGWQLSWGVTGISVSAFSLWSAAQSPGNSDEIALINATLAGADLFYLSDFADVADGKGGNDTLFGNGGHDFLYGNAGDDILLGGAGADKLDGGIDFDIADYSQDALAGGTHGIIVNLLTISGPAFVSDGFGTFDSLTSIEGVIGTDYADQLWGTNTRDHFLGGNGDDVLVAWAGDDYLAGGGNNDVLLGNAGVDTLLGDDGNDWLWGGDASDTLDGGNGSDVLVGDLQGLGETGNDMMKGGTGADTLLGGAGDDVLIGGTGSENGSDPGGVDWLVGGAGSDTLYGGAGNDVIWEQLDFGEGGNDVAYGGDGDDLILTGQGNDTLVGGSGNDRLYGGSGHDTFVFSTNWGADVVWDWENTEILDLRGSGVSSFGQLTITDSAANDVAITFGANSILLLGGRGLVDASDFIF